jgi:predicted AlkP superfamily phosphohydrolase/phosphomutase
MISGDGHTPDRVFVVGLDGATFDLIEPWAAEGKLPTLARLMAEGTHGVLRSVVPPLTTPAWASFLTGKTPGQHGLFSFLKHKANSYDMTLFNASYLNSEDLGSILSRRGRKVGLVNIPCTYPPKPLNGFVVTGLETPTRNSQFTYPVELRQELIDRFDYEVERTQKYSQGNEDTFLKAVESVEQKRLEAVLALMTERDWNLFAVVFRGTDILSHAFWRFMDTGHPAYDPALAARYGDTILRHYQKMDEAIAQMMARLPEDATLLLMSDHGSGRMRRYVFLDNYLTQLGLLKLKTDAGSSFRYRLFQLGLTPRNIIALTNVLGVRNLLRRLLPASTRWAVGKRFMQRRNIDWARTRAYPGLGPGLIQINLAGRQPLGPVQPGAEYEELVAYVTEKIHELRDPDTERPIVQRVWRKEEIYGPDHVDEVPDLYVEWVNDEYTDLGGIGYSREIMSEVNRNVSGGHTMRGIFLAWGPHIKPGHTLEEACIVDVAPTILYLLDVPVPADMEGVVLKEIFEDTLRQSRAIQFEEKRGRLGKKEEYVFSGDEQKAVEERLRNLGYIA